MPHRYRPRPFGVFDPARHVLGVEYAGGQADVRFVCRVVEIPDAFARRWAEVVEAETRRLGEERAEARGARRVNRFLRAGGIALSEFYRAPAIIAAGEGDEARFVQPLFGLN